MPNRFLPKANEDTIVAELVEKIKTYGCDVSDQDTGDITGMSVETWASITFDMVEDTMSDGEKFPLSFAELWAVQCFSRQIATMLRRIPRDGRALINGVDVHIKNNAVFFGSDKVADIHLALTVDGAPFFKIVFNGAFITVPLSEVKENYSGIFDLLEKTSELFK